MLSSAGDITDRCGNHPAAARAREILDVKTAVKEIDCIQTLVAEKLSEPPWARLLRPQREGPVMWPPPRLADTRLRCCTA
jgi:hypothetical protein